MSKNDKKRHSFVLYDNYSVAFDTFTDEEAGKLIKAIFRYDITGESVKLPASVQATFAIIAAQMDLDAEKYRERCEKNRENRTGQKNKGND